MPPELVTFPNSASVKVVSKTSEPPLARVIEPVLLKLVPPTRLLGIPMVTASPLETASVPELVNVVPMIVSAPPLEEAVIVPLLVKAPPEN